MQPVNQPDLWDQLSESNLPVVERNRRGRRPLLPRRPSSLAAVTCRRPRASPSSSLSLSLSHPLSASPPRRSGRLTPSPNKTTTSPAFAQLPSSSSVRASSDSDEGAGPALRRSSSASSEVENPIQGLIAYCKKS
nr:unnamed protein product [Digitaria exilis]